MINPIIDVYYKLVKAGSRTIDQVPESIRAEVENLQKKETTD
jgi:hypothetical protein